MSLQSIQALLDQDFADCQTSVESDGHTYTVTVISDVFAELNAVKRQQLVYKTLNPLIIDGSVHAVSIKALTPAEA